MDSRMSWSTVSKAAERSSATNEVIDWPPCPIGYHYLSLRLLSHRSSVPCMQTGNLVVDGTSHSALLTCKSMQRSMDFGNKSQGYLLVYSWERLGLIQLSSVRVLPLQ